MSHLLLAVLMAVATQGQQPGRTTDTQSSRQGGVSATTMLNGQWTLIYGEKQGQRMESATKSTVTIRDDVLTFTADGQQHTWRLNFGPHQTLTAFHTGPETGHTGTQTGRAQGTTGTGGLGNVTGNAGAGQGAAHHGVYIYSPDFLCLSLEPGTGVPGAGTTGTGTTGTGTGQTGGRTGTGGTTGTGTGQTGISRTGTGTVGGVMGGQPQQGSFVLILQRQGGRTGR